MSQLMDSISQSLGGDTMRQISGQLGADEQTTQSAISAALPMLLAGLARNSANQDGAVALHGALAKDHSGGIFDDLAGFLGNAQSGPGAGILRHVLGERQPMAQQSLSKTSGLDPQRAGQLLMMLAPIVMGALGRARQQNGLDASGLASMLGTEREGIRQKSPDLMVMARRVFDQDGDGSIADEVGGIVGKLFGGR